MTESAAPAAGTPKPKKSVALSGVTAGNTALSTVGRTGNDLHYRGYDILDIAAVCEFEEIAHLLVHEKLPTRSELSAYKARLKSLRAVPQQVREILERIPAASHPMDVMRTAVSALGSVEPEREGHDADGARAIADRLMASLGVDVALLAPLEPQRQAHRGRNRRRVRSAAISCTCCTARRRRPRGCVRCIPRSTCTRSTSSTPRPSPHG
jgi:citrate synthase